MFPLDRLVESLLAAVAAAIAAIATLASPNVPLAPVQAANPPSSASMHPASARQEVVRDAR